MGASLTTAVEGIVGWCCAIWQIATEPVTRAIRWITTDPVSTNYLTSLPATAFEHLFKFTDHGCHQDVLEAFKRSHNHSSPCCTHHCRRLHSSVRENVVRECTLLTAFWSVNSIRKNCYSKFSHREMCVLTDHAKFIKHLTVAVKSFVISKTMHQLLLWYVYGNTTLESIAFAVNALTNDAHAAVIPLSGPETATMISLAELIKALTEAGVTVSVTVCITSCKAMDVEMDYKMMEVLYYHRAGGPLAADWVSVLPANTSMLQHVELHMSHFSDTLLCSLGSTARGNSLRTLTICKDKKGSADPVPNLSSSAWTSLIWASPGVQVFCDINGVVPNMLPRLLKRGVPLTAITIHETSRRLQNEVIDHCRDFSKTLNCFKCYKSVWGASGRFRELVSWKYLMTDIIKTRSLITVL